MGLRTSSEWDTKPMGNVPGMTPRQESMSTARNPLAGQDMNEVKPPKTESMNVRSQQEQEQAGVEKAQKKQQAASSKKGQEQEANPTSQAVEQIASRMGNLGYTLRAKVNQLLAGRAQSTGFQSGTATFENGVLKTTQGAASLDPLIREKQQQQQDIKNTMSPFTTEVNGKLQAKTFGTVVKEQFGNNPEVASILQTVAALQELKARGLSGSPEALALEEQISQQDKFGMVSQLRDAMTEYNRLMGIDDANEVKWYGGSMADVGGNKTGYGAIDLANLGEGILKTELEKAQAFTSGLFSGDFEENLKKTIDEESAENRANAARASQLNSELYSAYNSFRTSTSKEFGDARKKITDQMNAAAQTVRAAMILTPEGREGLQWFDALLKGSNGDMSAMLFKALSNPDTGLGRDQRDAIRNFIGEVGAATGGQLDLWMQQLGSTGKVGIKDAQGKWVDVEPSATQKLQMMDIMGDTATTPEQKQASMQKLVRSIGIDAETNIGKSVDAALNTAKNTGSMTLALGAFTTSLASSLKTYADSRTSDAVMQALGLTEEDWNTPVGKQDIHDKRAIYIRQALMKDPNLAETLRGQITAKQQSDQAQFNTVIASNRDTAKKTIEKLDVLEKGNADTPSLEQRKQAITSSRDAVPQKLASKLLVPLQGVDARASTYLQGLQNNPVLREWSSANPKVAERLPKLAKMFSMLDSLKTVGSSYPGLADAIYPDWRNPKAAEQLVRSFRQNYNNADQLDAVFARFNQYATSPDGKPSPQLLGAVSEGITRWKQDPSTRNATAQAVLTNMELADKQLAQLNDVGTKIANKRATLTENLATMDKMVEDMKIPAFNPDEILQGVLGMSRGLENILNGKGIPGLDLTPDNLATIIPGLAAGGSNTAGAIPDKIKTMLTQLGIPMEAWTIVNGIPTIKMGDGKFIPIGGKEFADLTASMGAENYTTPVDIPTFEGMGDFAPVSAGEMPTIDPQDYSTVTFASTNGSEKGNIEQFLDPTSGVLDPTTWSAGGINPTKVASTLANLPPLSPTAVINNPQQALNQLDPSAWKIGGMNPIKLSNNLLSTTSLPKIITPANSGIGGVGAKAAKKIKKLFGR
jgi:hypothetical protein